MPPTPAGDGAVAAPLADAKPGKLGVWLHALRIPTLSAAVVPVIVGTALAWRHGAAHPWAGLAALIGAIAIQIGTNLANDLFDYRKGADLEGRIGPPRVLAVGWLEPSEVRRGMIAAFAIATAAGVVLTMIAGWPVVLIGIASILAGVGYTAGRFALGYIGLGDIAVFVFFGLVAVVGTFYVETGMTDPEAILAAIPVGSLATAILIVNNVRDLDTDRVAGKRTLAVFLGRGGARAEFVAFLFAAYAIPLGLWAQGLRNAWILLPLATVSLGAHSLARVLEREDGPALNAALRDTARLHLLFGLLFAAGLYLG